MKDRVTLTLDRDIVRAVDGRVDGTRIKNRSHAIELLLRKSLRGDSPQVAVILAGGKGEDVHPLTRGVPKSLLEVKGKPILQYNIDLCKRSGIKEIIISIGHMAEQIREYVLQHAGPDLEITFVEEKQPLGTAGPLRLLKDRLDSTFVLMNGDELKDVNLQKMYHAHLENEALTTIALTTTDDPSGYGVALMDGSNIVSFVEKPGTDAQSKLINAGIYIVEPEVIGLVPKGYAMLEYDVFPKVAKKGGLHGYPFSGQWLGTDTKELLEKARREWKGISPA